MSATVKKSEETDYTWRDEHVGRLLFEAQHDFQRRSLERLRALGYEDVTLAYINIIASTSTGGTRLTDIAEKLSISKQAAGQMVKELVDKGYLARQRDPDDGRAALVMFTEKGEKLLEEAVGGIQDIETLYKEVLGAETFTALKEALVALLGWTREEV